MVGKKTDTLDYLKACTVVRKIYQNFDLNENESLEKEELKLLIDTLIEENTTVNQGKQDAETDLLREWYRKLKAEKPVSQIQLTKAICDFLKVKPPALDENDLPIQLIQKSAVLKRVIKKKGNAGASTTESEITVQNKH